MEPNRNIFLLVHLRELYGHVQNVVTDGAEQYQVGQNFEMDVPIVDIISFQKNIIQ